MIEVLSAPLQKAVAAHEVGLIYAILDALNKAQVVKLEKGRQRACLQMSFKEERLQPAATCCLPETRRKTTPQAAQFFDIGCKSDEGMSTGMPEVGDFDVSGDGAARGAGQLSPEHAGGLELQQQGLGCAHGQGEAKAAPGAPPPAEGADEDEDDDEDDAEDEAATPQVAGSNSEAPKDEKVSDPEPSAGANDERGILDEAARRRKAERGAAFKRRMEEQEAREAARRQQNEQMQQHHQEQQHQEKEMAPHSEGEQHAPTGTRIAQEVAAEPEATSADGAAVQGEQASPEVHLGATAADAAQQEKRDEGKQDAEEGQAVGSEAPTSRGAPEEERRVPAVQQKEEWQTARNRAAAGQGPQEESRRWAARLQVSGGRQDTVERPAGRRTVTRGMQEEVPKEVSAPEVPSRQEEAEERGGAAAAAAVAAPTPPGPKEEAGQEVPGRQDAEESQTSGIRAPQSRGMQEATVLAPHAGASQAAGAQERQERPATGSREAASQGTQEEERRAGGHADVSRGVQQQEEARSGFAVRAPATVELGVEEVQEMCVEGAPPGAATPPRRQEPPPEEPQLPLGSDPLLFATENGDLPEVERLLQARADPNEPDAMGETPLFEAAASGKVDLAATLLLHGADPGHKADNGMLASDFFADEATEALLNIFADKEPSVQGEKALVASLSEPLRARVAQHLQGKSSADARPHGTGAEEGAQRGSWRTRFSQHYADRAA